MSYLYQLTEEEVSYICSSIPVKNVIAYCRQHPKSFAKIMPGFRARAIAKYGSDKLLFRNRNKGFVASFIERHIRDWLGEVREHIEKCIADGDSEDLAYIRILPYSFFADNVPLYFRLIGEERPESYISLLGATVREIKEVNEAKEGLEANINGLRQELDSSVSALKEAEEKLSEYADEINQLKHDVLDHENLKAIVCEKEAIISLHNAAIKALEEETRDLAEELSAVRLSRQELEVQIAAGLEKHEKGRATEVAKKALAPKDEAEFKEYLEYNLDSIGVPVDSQYFRLLVDHLNCILFQGVPVVINRSTGITLMNCVANTLVGLKRVDRLTYESSLSIQCVEDFLTEAGRVVCLDNFIGNYNETMLLPLFERHRNKIIFLTTVYERTLNFVPGEFLRYCFYLNLNRIPALTLNAELTEDPSTIEEEDVAILKPSRGSRYRLLLSEILSDFGVSRALVEHKSAAVSDEQDLCRSLAFDVLPYARDVLQIAPYNVSERFNRYAGNTGRCPYKDLFRSWFA